MELLDNLDNFVTMLIAVFVALEAIIGFFLSAEKAEKFSFVGKILNFLKNTKAGFSVKKDDRLDSKNN